jgi:hypothetical protein
LAAAFRFRAARNRVTALVRRDKEASNLAKLAELGNLPAVLWEVANAAVGKPHQPLLTLVTRADGTTTWLPTSRLPTWLIHTM